MAEIETGSAAGPASYPTGGFTIDTGLATVGWFGFSRRGGSLVGDVEIVRNSPAAGRVTVKLVRWRYERLSSIGAMSGLPAGVTAANTSGQSYDADAAHTHGIDHDHGGFNSPGPNFSANGTNTGALNNEQTSAHTHDINIPNHVATSGAGSSHNHTESSLYEHQQLAVNTQTNATRTETANGTNLSAITFDWMAVE